MEKIFSPITPEAIDLYAQAIITDNLVAYFRQTPLNFYTMKMYEITIEEQSKRYFKILEAVLVVKTYS